MASKFMAIGIPLGKADAMAAAIAYNILNFRLEMPMTLSIDP